MQSNDNLLVRTSDLRVRTLGPGVSSCVYDPRMLGLRLKRQLLPDVKLPQLQDLGAEEDVS